MTSKSFEPVAMHAIASASPFSFALSGILAECWRRVRSFQRPSACFIAAQLGEEMDELCRYAETDVTRRRHLIELRQVYGFKMFSGHRARELNAWLAGEAEVATSNHDLARRLVEECRRTQTILPPTGIYPIFSHSSALAEADPRCDRHDLQECGHCCRVARPQPSRSWQRTDRTASAAPMGRVGGALLQNSAGEGFTSEIHAVRRTR